MIEVYPHAALVALFDLPSIIRYRKGDADSGYVLNPILRPSTSTH